MKLLVKEDPRTLALVSRTHVLLFRSVPKKAGADRCAIEFLPRPEVDLSGYRVLSQRAIDGFLGLIEVEGDTFLCCITNSKRVAAPVPGESVSKILSVEFVSLTRSIWDFVDLDSNGYPILPDSESGEPMAENPEYIRHPCHGLKKLLSGGGFYYSSDCDVTRTLQSRGIGTHSLSLDDYCQEYMWNSFMLEEMVQFRNRLDKPVRELLDDEGFLTTVIRGFAETFETQMGRDKVAMTIVSRQSWKRAGTRFNSRGIDDDANVANFVETELIVYSKSMCYAYTQIRGSVPVFWEQDTALINPRVQITRSQEATQPVFDKHFERLLNTYSAVNIVNLLSTKSSELPLTQRYHQHVKDLVERGTPDLYMTDFDFHRETADKGFAAANKIFSKIKESLYEFGYFSFDVQRGKVLSEQSGVFRTNCLDCLDRTNLIQQFISSFALTIFLKDQDQRISQESDFFSKHNTLWADHGDQISQIYTGTNALKSSFSRSGKMSFAGKLSDATKSVSRMYINNFMDKDKQNTIDMLLGRLSGQNAVLLYDPITDYVNAKLPELQHQFSTHDSINVFAGTYNVNGATRVDDLSEWLYPIGDKFKPNVVVLGFQEVIELTAGSIINADYSKSSLWTQAVEKCLNQHDKYLMLRAEQMSSLLLLFFVRSDSTQHVKRVEGGSKKTGLGGMTGNKGAVAIRFNYGASSFCFVNVHLAAGTEKVQERNNDYMSITNGIKFTRGQTINDNDSVFWLGDLNYRISLPNDDVRYRVERSDYDYLIQYDQLTNEIKSRGAFDGFSEPSLNFRPTYKYDKGTDRYDSSEKARTPSWTDRIIYRSKSVKPMAYSSSDRVMFSDHKPVYAAYKAKVEFVDEEKKLSLEKQLYQQFKAEHSDDASLSLIEIGDEKAKEKKSQSYKAVEVPNFLDDDENYKPQLPVRRANTEVTPPPSFGGEILMPSNKKSSAPPSPARRATVTATPPPPPAPRTASSTTTSTSTEKKSSPPPVPSPRKPAALPPGFDTVLTPKSSGTPSRSTTPSLKPSTAPPVKPKKPESLSTKTPPVKPPKPEVLSSTSTGTSTPQIPKKPESLSSTGSIPLVPKKPASLKTESTTTSPPPPPPARHTMESWKPLVPK